MKLLKSKKTRGRVKQVRQFHGPMRQLRVSRWISVGKEKKRQEGWTSSIDPIALQIRCQQLSKCYFESLSPVPSPNPLRGPLTPSFNYLHRSVTVEWILGTFLPFRWLFFSFFSFELFVFQTTQPNASKRYFKKRGSNEAKKKEIFFFFVTYYSKDKME